MTSRRPLHPRAPQLPPIPGLREPAPKPVYSRWQGSSTAFGPRGRIAATALVLLFLGISFFYMLLPLWLILVGAGVVVLRDVWKKTRLTPQPSTPAAPASPIEPKPEPIVEPTPGWLIALRVAGVIAFIGVVVAWQLSNNTGKAIIGMTGSLAALVVAFAWFLRR